jgi:hypothetical protein
MVNKSDSGSIQQHKDDVRDSIKNNSYQAADSYIAHRIQSKDIQKFAKEFNLPLPESSRLAMRSDSLQFYKSAPEQ